jgi:hypothetical protein
MSHTPKHRKRDLHAESQVTNTQGAQGRSINIPGQDKKKKKKDPKIKGGQGFYEFGGAQPADPLWSSVAILMDFEQDATIEDNTNFGYFPKPINNTNLVEETAAPIVQTRSVDMPGAKDFMEFALDGWGPSVGKSNMLQLAQKEWTLEWSWNFDALPATTETVAILDIWTQYATTGDERCLLMGMQGTAGGVNHGLRILGDNDGTTGTEADQVLDCQAALATGTDYDFAVTRSGDNFLLHIDGVYKDSVTLGASWDFFTNSEDFRLGSRNAGVNNCVNGKVDRIRLTMDQARYAASTNYTPSDNYDENGNFLRHGDGFQFPRRVEQQVAGQGNASSVTHTIQYPSVANGNPAELTVGNMLLVQSAHGANETVTAWPDGLIALSNDTASLCGQAVAWKQIDGTEGETGDATLSGACGGSMVAHEIYIPGWNGTDAPEIGTFVTGTGVSANPPAVTGLDDAARYLAMIVFCNDNEAGGMSAGPDPDTDQWYQINRSLGSGANGASNGWCFKAFADATSIDPGACTVSSSLQYIINTLAIKGGYA